MKSHRKNEKIEGSLRLRSPWTVLMVVLPTVFIGWMFARPHMAPDLTPEEQLGKQIYFEGEGAEPGNIIAYIGADQVRLPGSAATCASCHGPDGKGRPEAGVIPSDITWSHLTKPYGHIHSMGREHPVFTEADLKRCILNGYDPAGNRLDSSMPTYTMKMDEINSLVAYMKLLEVDFDPGLEQTGIRIGTVSPSQGKIGEIGRAINEVIFAYFEEINSEGGVYNRKIELVSSPYEEDGRTAFEEVSRMVQKEDVFALVGPVITGDDREILELTEERKVPVIGPLSSFSPDPYMLNEFTFYLYSGLNEQAKALVDFAARHLKLDNPQIAVIGKGDALQKEMQTAIMQRCEKYNWDSLSGFGISSDGFNALAAAEMFKTQNVDCLFVTSFGEAKKLLEAAEKIGWQPFVFLPGILVEKELLQIPGIFQNKIYISYPTLPSDQTPEGLLEFVKLIEKHDISVEHPAFQIHAYVAAKIILEGLKRGGKDISREKFVRVLEKLYEFKTGLTPPITYGPNRRIGSTGSYIVAVDLKSGNFLPAGEWVELSGNF